jgi:hypothetical protein
MALKVEGIVDGGMLRKHWTDRADLNRCILHGTVNLAGLAALARTDRGE